MLFVCVCARVLCLVHAYVVLCTVCCVFMLVCTHVYVCLVHAHTDTAHSIIHYHYRQLLKCLDDYVRNASKGSTEKLSKTLSVS